MALAHICVNWEGATSKWQNSPWIWLLKPGTYPHTAWNVSVLVPKCQEMPGANGHMIISYSRATLEVGRKVETEWFLSSSAAVGTLCCSPKVKEKTAVGEESAKHFKACWNWEGHAFIMACSVLQKHWRKFLIEMMTLLLYLQYSRNGRKKSRIKRYSFLLVLGNQDI